MNQHVGHNTSGNTEPLTIPVEGMTCASCVRRVETGAAKLPGVRTSAVNFATKKLTVETGEGFDPQALEKAIHKLGYEVPAGAMEHALREAGMAVPGDIAVTGFDDVPLARYLGLTTVRITLAEMGARATARLIDALDGGALSPDTEIIATELIIRSTTGPLPT